MIIPNPNAQTPPILAAVDLDAHGQRCLGYAWQRALHSGEPVVVAHVAHETMGTAGSYQRRNRAHRPLPMTEIARQLLNELVDDFLHETPDPTAVAVERLVLTGIPGTRIPELARYLSAGAIVIGSSDASPWRRLFRGSVTGAVLRRAPCPVVVINKAGDPICHHGMLPDRSPRADSQSLLGLP